MQDNLSSLLALWGLIRECVLAGVTGMDGIWSKQGFL